ncbi:hypothetical protein BH09MYX1_BH09MYX1_35920 [soil metagenome]
MIRFVSPLATGALFGAAVALAVACGSRQTASATDPGPKPDDTLLDGGGRKVDPTTLPRAETTPPDSPRLPPTAKTSEPKDPPPPPVKSN